MKLRQYLDNIEQGKAINLDRFIKCLPFADPLEWSRVYQASRVRGGYLLTIVDHARHSTLYPPETEDRVSASKVGNSHDHPCSYAHILVLNNTCSQRIPFVVLSDQHGFKTQGTLLGKQALIVENVENFYRHQAFLTAIGYPSFAAEYDILLGSGNQITDSLNTAFLSSYQKLFCAHDIDLGGLTIYQTLKASLPNVSWLSPRDWQLFRDKFQLSPKDPSHLTKAIKLARELGLNDEADLMNQNRAFLEQEAFLPEIQRK